MTSKILIDWISSFPVLKRYTTTKILKIYDPLLIGIQLDIMPDGENYRPYFVIYPLWEPTLKECLEYPAVWNPMCTEYSIPFNEHEDYFERAINQVNNELPLDFYQDIHYKDIESLLLKYANEPIIKAQGDLAILQILEFNFYLSLLVNNKHKSIEIIESIIQNASFRSSTIINKIYGDIDILISRLKLFLDSSDALKATVKSNCANKKLKNLNYSKLNFP